MTNVINTTFIPSKKDFGSHFFKNHSVLWYRKDGLEAALKISFFIPILLVSTTGNFLIVSVIFKFPNTRTNTNLFICNMAIADLISTILFAWTGIVNGLYQNYVLGPFFCKTESFAKVFFLLASVFSLTWISCDRLINIVNPFRKPKKKCYTYIIIGLIWVSAFFIALPFVFWKKYKTRQWADILEIWCKESVEKVETYYLFILAFLVYIPFAIMINAYAIIIIKMSKFESQANTTTNSLAYKYRRQVIKMLFFYLITSALCWSPLQVTILYRYFTPRKPDVNPPWYNQAYFSSHVFVSLNSALNPIVYGFVNETFRKSLCILYPTITSFFGINKRNRPPRNQMDIKIFA